MCSSASESSPEFTASKRLYSHVATHAALQARVQDWYVCSHVAVNAGVRCQSSIADASADCS